MDKYEHGKIEKKWQKKWEQKGVFAARDNDSRPKFYALIEFPYPSGEGLHVGHPRSYTAMDIIARKRRMEGYNVLYPIGFDSFGLPTENYAIKTGRPPAEITRENIANFTKQLKSLGFSFDWERAVTTSDPAYYKWTQWIFLQLFKHGLAYKTKMPINWCPSCKIGLANEEVVDGCCERCGASVEKREKEQWMLAITKYADKLLEGLKEVDYIERAKVQQENWIGKSVGALLQFTVVSSQFTADRHSEEPRDLPARLGREESHATKKNARSFAAAQDDKLGVIEVFTTRPDTLFGATYLVLAPEHEIIKNVKLKIKNWDEVEEYIQKVRNKTEQERTAEGKEKTGVELKGIKAINPATKEEIPIWVADYVLAHYGTGAIMAVPAHDARDFEFAKKYGLPIICVIDPITIANLRNYKIEVDGKMVARGYATISHDPSNQTIEDAKKKFIEEVKLGKHVHIGDGVLINSGAFSGLDNETAKWKIMEAVGGQKKVTYKLRDWVFSRQRYWGEPIPLVWCDKCNEWVPLPEKELPLELPKVEKYQPTDTGESPLAGIEKWVKTKCPRCGGSARRETDTMPNWAGSSWYFLRYCDPKNDKEFASMEKLKYWMGTPTPPNLPSGRGGSESISPPLGGGVRGGGVDWYNGGMEHTVLHLLYSRFWNQFLYDIGVVPTREPYKKRTSHGLILAEDGEKMSKSRGNVVNPNEIVEQYGADVLRVYEMFMGPFDQAVPWSTKSIVGVERFLERVWGLQNKLQEVTGGYKKLQEVTALERLVHKTVKKVTEDIEAMKYNTAIAAMMSLVNELSKNQIIPHTSYLIFLKLLSPFAPHICEELNERRCQVSGVRCQVLTTQPWPTWDPALVKDEEIELVVQVNGRVRERLKVTADIDETEVKALALASEKVKKWLDGQKVKEVIFVKGRLLNIVV